MALKKFIYEGLLKLIWGGGSLQVRYKLFYNGNKIDDLVKVLCNITGKIIMILEHFIRFNFNRNSQ